MVEYYNLSKVSDADGTVGMIKNISNMTGQWFGISLIMTVFVIPLYTMIKGGTETNEALHLSSFYALLFSILMYVGQIVTYSIIMYIFSLIWVTTLIIRWYNKR